MRGTTTRSCHGLSSSSWTSCRTRKSRSRRFTTCSLRVDWQLASERSVACTGSFWLRNGNNCYLALEGRGVSWSGRASHGMAKRGLYLTGSQHEADRYLPSNRNSRSSKHCDDCHASFSGGDELSDEFTYTVRTRVSAPDPFNGLRGHEYYQMRGLKPRPNHHLPDCAHCALMEKLPAV